MVGKAKFARKPVNLDDLKRINIENNEMSNYVIEKTLVLARDQYDKIASRLFDNHDCIEKNKDIMSIDDSNVFHCLLIQKNGAKDGILIESEGYGHARYAAYLEGMG